MAGFSTGKKLAVAGLIVIGATVYMAYVGASASWRYYLTVKECVDHAEQVAGQRIRVSGSIAAGSLKIRDDRQEARFELTEEGKSVSVVCTGPLPDDLSPTKSMDVVVEGRLDETCTLRGEKLITRCASKYSAQQQPTATASRQSGGEVVR